MQSTLTPPNTQQVPIPVPPKILSTKDTMYIKDILSWQLLAAKKFSFFSQQAQNPQVKEVLAKAGKMHQRHYDLLMSHLQINNDSALNSIPKTQQPASH